jgi:hypothetical protein
LSPFGFKSRNSGGDMRQHASATLAIGTRDKAVAIGSIDTTVFGRLLASGGAIKGCDDSSQSVIVSFPEAQPRPLLVSLGEPDANAFQLVRGRPPSADGGYGQKGRSDSW